jgi:hypothetical protein
MTIPLYLHAIDYKILPEKAGTVPRARYRQYWEDLYRIYPGQISPQTFYEGSQYNYAELGDALFEQLKHDELQQLDTIILAHWSQEFDPDYASCAAYFLHKYGLTADFFDVCDQGTLAAFTALKLLGLAQQQHSTHGMVLCLEQTTIPRDKAHGDVIPVESGALAIFLSRVFHRATPWPLLLRAVEIVPQGVAIKKIAEFAAKIKKIMTDYSDKNQPIQFIVRKGTMVWKLLNYYRLNKTLALGLHQLSFIEPHPGCLSAFKKVAALLQQTDAPCIYLLLDEDVESCSFAYLVLERLG